MNVKKIFIILVTVVACVVLGAFVLNILMPNVTTSLINSVETMVYNATGMDFDWNNDGNKGSQAKQGNMVDGTDTVGAGEGVGVEGFKAGGGTP